MSGCGQTRRFAGFLLCFVLLNRTENRADPVPVFGAERRPGNDVGAPGFPPSESLPESPHMPGDSRRAVRAEHRAPWPANPRRPAAG